MNNYCNSHMNYVKNTYSEEYIDIEEFCSEVDFEEINFEYLKDFYFLTFEDSLQNNYYIYKDEEDLENEIAKKELLGKISIIDYFIDTPYITKEDYGEIDSYILKNKLLILKIRFSNLQYYTMHDTDIFKKIYIIDENLKIIRNLCNSNLETSKYGKIIGYSRTDTRKYLPKISYSVTLAFSIPNNIKNYMIGFEGLYIEGDGIKRIQKDLYVDGNEIKRMEVESKKNKDLSNREKCPRCNSFDTVKDGKRNGKQCYKCNICKRKFTENKTIGGEK